MTRYIKQYAETTCGPVALINSLKWAGIDATHEKTLEKAKKETAWDIEGVYTGPFIRGARKMGRGLFTVSHLQYTPKTVKNHILDGGAAYLTHIAYDGIHHLSFAVEGDTRWCPFKIINAQLRENEPTEYPLS